MHVPKSFRRPLALAGHVSSTQALLATAVLVALAQAAPAQLQFEELAKRALPADRDSTVAAATGDVDGDGDLDIVFGNRGSWSGGQQNRLYLNDGTGTFNDATAARMPVDNDKTTCVALGDVDGDGDLDMVFGNSGDSPAPGQQNRLYLNNGTGTFTDVTAARMPVDSDYTTGVALGDVDGDGDLDMVFTNFAQQVRLYRNNGSGTFIDASASMPVGGFGANSVAIGDVDGDGDRDLVFGNYGQNRLYLNNGTGTFTDATTARMPVEFDNTTCVALGDVDGDGDRDLVCGNSDDPFGVQNRLYLNNGSGTFTDATATRMPIQSHRTTGVVLGDIDGDSDLDMLFGNSNSLNGFINGQNRLYLNNGTGTFTDATAARMPADHDDTTCVALGDVDGDSDVDLVFGNWNQQHRLYVNNGTGTFLDATAARMPADNDRTTCVAVGDVDGDNDLDLVFGNFGIVGPSYISGQRTRLYLNNGRGTFTDATTARMPVIHDWTTCVALGDIDGDGDLDIVVGNGLEESHFPSGVQNRLYRNNGTGTFTDATAALPVNYDCTACVALGDVDGDGDLDLVFGKYPYYGSGGQNLLYLNNGSGTFTDATAARMPVDNDDTSAVAFGDVDGDGDLDLVFGNWPQSRLYLNNGSGTFIDASAGMPVGNYATRDVALGDVDGDGDLDLVFANSGQNRLYLNNGTGTFIDATAALMPAVNDNTWAVALGDSDGDGDLDLVLGNSGQDRLYLNNGSGTFIDATATRMPADGGGSAAFGDVDRDGDLDLVFGNGGQNRLYLNLLRQLDAPFLLRVGHTYQLDVYARYGPPRLVDVAGAFLSTTSAAIPLPPWGHPRHRPHQRDPAARLRHSVSPWRRLGHDHGA